MISQFLTMGGPASTQPTSAIVQLATGQAVGADTDCGNASNAATR